MSLEQYSNNASTTTTASVNNTSNPVTIAVTDASKFPSAGNFRILIDQELLIVTSVSSNNLTASRAAEGTSIASHSSGATVTHILTAASLIQAIKDRLANDTWANRPTSSQAAGRIFIPTDSRVLQYDTGSALKYAGPLFTVSPVISSNFTWLNQQSSSFDDPSGVLTVNNAGSGGVDTFNILKKSAPSTPYTVTTLLNIRSCDIQMMGGILFRASASGKIISFNIYFNGTTQSYMRVTKYSTNGTFDSNYKFVNFGTTLIDFAPIFLQIKDDGTNLKFNYGPDGSNWMQFYSVSRTDYAAPNEVGIHGSTNTTQQTVPVAFHHYLEA